MKEQKNVINELENLCVEIFAHASLDWEITLSGNGTNPCEATNVALEILDIIHGDGRRWRKSNEKKIVKCAKELER